MDIQETIDIRYEEIEGLKQNLSEDHYMNPEQEDELEELITKAIKFGELCAKRDAKAQAVPEWAVIVPKLSANYLFNTVPELGFEHQDQKDTVLYHLNYMASEFRDSAKQFVEDDHAKQKNMIEAQEPTND